MTRKELLKDNRLLLNIDTNGRCLLYFKEVSVMAKKEKKVGFWTILWNVILTCVTSGLWLIWLLIKYLKKNS